ncbi:hypothetical protein [Spongiibacter sp.]|uniref:hypothetical protein n=1 Tax=Spongiibacter sp. TaxID=2024860 RepID=UPI000C441247|nr:hypothetical protein [Spongiibacter sp.]MBU72840.1 hypothetical protein [Spongiibacter sp.]|tara:strand:+ start:122 stop:382 length:261 start_codon:yes stop_codon:yes gene_type:complete
MSHFLMFFKRKSVEYWMKHEKKLRAEVQFNLRVSLILIPTYMLLWHFQIVLFIVLVSISGYIFFNLIVSLLALQEVKARLGRPNDS